MKDLQVPVHLPSIISQLTPREPHGPCKEKICPEKDFSFSRRLLWLSTSAWNDSNYEWIRTKFKFHIVVRKLVGNVELWTLMITFAQRARPRWRPKRPVQGIFLRTQSSHRLFHGSGPAGTSRRTGAWPGRCGRCHLCLSISRTGRRGAAPRSETRRPGSL